MTTLTLALAIASSTALFTVVNATLLRPLPYGHQERLVIAFEKRRKEGTQTNGVTPADYLDWRAQSHTFRSLTAHDERAFNLTGPDYTSAPERVIGLLSTTDLLSTYDVQPVLGRSFEPGDEKTGRTAMLSYGLWRRRFGGDRHVLGKAVMLDGESYSIIGVMPANFRMYIGQPVDVYVPLVITPQRSQDRGGHDYLVVGRIRDGVALAAAQSEMDAISARLERQYPEFNTGHAANLVPIASFVTAKIRPALALLAGAVMLLLLVACANVASLLLARAVARRRELAIRMALGAANGHIVRLLLGESLTLAAAGGLLGVLLAHWLLPVIAMAAPKMLGTGIVPGLDRLAVDTGVLLFAVGLSLLAGLAAGIAPALRFLRAHPSLSERSPGAGLTDRRARALLVIGELGLSSLLLVAAGLLGQSFFKLSRVDPGFQIAHRLTLELSLPAARYPDGRARADWFERLIERVDVLASVRSAAVTSSVPGVLWGPRTGLRREGQPPALSIEDTPKVYWRVVSEDFFASMGIPIVRGRGFTHKDTADASPVLLITQATARRYWGAGEDPVGQHVQLPFRKDWYTVVGVTGDLHQLGPDKDVYPEVFLPLAQFPQSSMWLTVLTSGDPLALTRAVEHEIALLDRELPVSHIQTVEQLVAQGTAPHKFDSAVIAAFAALALLLAAAGLYSVMAYLVTQRTQEIGIRMALGAQPAHVRRMILAEVAKLAGGGTLLGLACAPLLGRLLRGMLFGISAADPVTYAVVAAVLLAVALAASTVPARRATKIDPIQALTSQ